MGADLAVRQDTEEYEKNTQYLDTLGAQLSNLMAEKDMFEFLGELTFEKYAGTSSSSASSSSSSGSTLRRARDVGLPQLDALIASLLRATRASASR